MKRNIHSFEKVARILLGAGLISLAFVGPKNLWFLLGVVPLVTGLASYCPLYQLLGISTCGKCKNPE